MAIVSMKKVRLLTPKSDVSEVLKIVQTTGVLEFKFVDLANVPELEKGSVSGESHSKLIKTKQAIDFLSNYEAKVGTFAKLRQGTLIGVKETELNQLMSSEEIVMSLVDELFLIQQKLTKIEEEIAELTEKKELFNNWLGFKNSLSATKTKSTETYFVKLNGVTKNNIKSSFSTSLESVLQSNQLDAFIEEVATNLFTVTIYSQEAQSAVASAVKDLGGEIVQLPAGVGTPSEEVDSINSKITLLIDERKQLEKYLSDLISDKLKLLRVAHDFYNWNLDLENTLNEALLTKRIAVLEGWCESEELNNLKSRFEKVGVVCFVEEIEITKDEEPPVSLKNNSLIKPFEFVTKLSGLPGYRDLDPTPFMALFFFLFFGLALTDVGYGLTLMIVSLPFLVYFVVSESIKQFAKLIFLVGLSTSIIGLFFGGYFGISMSKMPEFIQALQVFDPIANPLPVFYLALAMGVIQVMFGLLLKVVSEAKNGRLVEGILTQGTWLFLFFALILFGASSLGYLTSVSADKVVTLVYVAAIAVMLGNGMVGKTIGEKIKLSLLSAYGSVSYFSDILSYSRLLALGLATSALAFAVNLIAGMVSEMVPYVGVVLAVVVLFVGHVFTLVINTLGSFIHSARLQFIEFFGKFIAGTGKEFKPLTRKKVYINLKDSSG